MALTRSRSLLPVVARLDWRVVLRVALTLVVYLGAFTLLDWFTHVFQEQPGVVAWYPPDGLSFALLLAFGVRFAPALVLSSLISSFLIYRLPQPAEWLVLWAVVLSAVYGLAAAFLRRRVRFDWQLRHRRDLLWLVLSTVLVSAVLAALSTSGSVLSGGVPQIGNVRTTIHWWIGEMIGVLVLTPFLLVHVVPRAKRFLEKRPEIAVGRLSYARPSLPVIGQALSLALLLYWVFHAGGLAEFHPMYLLFLPLIWIALHHGLAGAAIGIVALNFGATFAIWAFRFADVQLSELQLLMFVICVVALLMGKAVSDQKATLAELSDKARALEASAQEQEVLLEQTRRQKEQTAGVAMLGTALAETLDLNAIYERLYHAVVSFLPDSDSVFISLFDKEHSLFRCAWAMSEGERFDVAALPPAPLEPPGVGSQSEAVHTRRPVIINDMPTRLGQTRVHVELDSQRMPQSGLYVPMLAKDHVIGVVITQSLTLNRYSDSDAALVSLVANTAAVAIQNASLYEQTQRALTGTIQALASTAEARDPYTSGHQHRVCDLTCAMAREMGLPAEALDGLRVAALLHDIGKLAVPAEILSKPTELTPIEFALIKTHPAAAHEILKGIEFPWPVAEIVLQHHERMDGSGYPDGIKGDEILPEARILAVADVVEAMASHRPYRPALGIDQALGEVARGAGKVYDEQAAAACLRLFTEGRFAFEGQGC